MRITALLIIGILAIGLGCARVQVEAPKEPIKVDVTMRLDIYQHVAKDIDDIESIVSGSGSNPGAQGQGSFLNLFVGNAYAQGEALSSEVESAALRRKGRYQQLTALEEDGIVGENKWGLVEIRVAQKADSATKDLIGKENSDRMVIYKEIAVKNGATIEEVQAMYAKRLQSDAPSGTPIEAFNEQSGKFEWKIKK